MLHLLQFIVLFEKICQKFFFIFRVSTLVTYVWSIIRNVQRREIIKNNLSDQEARLGKIYIAPTYLLAICDKIRLSRPKSCISQY